MTSVEINVIIILLSVLMVCGVAIGGLSAILRKRRMVEFNKGPGNPEEPAPTSPWRRFAGALGAPYARPEWLRVPVAKQLHAPEQVYYGYASAMTPFAVSNVLRIDWGVKNQQQAHERLLEAHEVITEQAVAVAAERGFPGGEISFREKLVRAGASADVVDDFIARVHEVSGEENGETDIDGLAFDIARVSNLVRWSGNVRYVEAGQGDAYLEGVGVSAAAVFRDWDDFSRAYLAGLSTRFKGGSKHYIKAVEWLRADFSSPWFRQPWITAVKSSS